MRLQQRLSAEVQEAKVGTIQRVVIDRMEGDYYIGRTQFDSPEVDPEVLIPITMPKGASEGISPSSLFPSSSSGSVSGESLAGASLQIGHFYDVRITSSDDFDLYALPLKESL